MTTTMDRTATEKGRAAAPAARKGSAARQERARRIVEEGGVRRWRGEHLVRGSRGESYRVADGRCECEDYARHKHLLGYACKHVMAAFRYERALRCGPVVVLPAPRGCPVGGGAGVEGSEAA